MSYELKTKENDASVEEFLNAVPDEGKRKDCFTLLEMMREVTGEEARMWGGAIVGFGSYHYRYASGHEGDAPVAAFSPRKQNLTVYLTAGFSSMLDLMGRLGRCKTGVSCLYVKKLDDIDLDVLRELVGRSVAAARG